VKRIRVTGLDGTSPLGFMASVGLLRVLDGVGEARLGFSDDGSGQPHVETEVEDLATLVAEDAHRGEGKQPWSLEYQKEEKRGVKSVADLKAPPPVFRAFLAEAVSSWTKGESEAAAYAALFGTSVAVDGKGNTKPTAFHFTAANQQFLDTVDKARSAVTVEWAKRSLYEGRQGQPGSNLRWDPAAERSWALMANDPTSDGTRVDAPAEWLAFRALPVWASFPSGSRILTTGVDGRGDDMTFSWPLWAPPADLATVVSLLRLPWRGSAGEHTGRGVFAVCRSSIRRTSQGFGNFAPASVSP
jgi:hypothetical protein